MDEIWTQLLIIICFPSDHCFEGRLSKSCSGRLHLAKLASDFASQFWMLIGCGKCRVDHIHARLEKFTSKRIAAMLALQPTKNSSFGNTTAAFVIMIVGMEIRDPHLKF